MYCSFCSLVVYFSVTVCTKYVCFWGLLSMRILSQLHNIMVAK